MTLAALALCFSSHAAPAIQSPPANPTRTPTVRLRRLKRSGTNVEVLPREAFRARLSGDPHLPQNLAQIRAYLQGLHAAKPSGGADECGEAEMGRFAVALQNPDLADADLEGVDSSFAEGKPNLPKTITSGHFKLKYTDIDTDPQHNTTESRVKELAKVLNDAYDDFALNFKAPSHYLDGDLKEWIDIEIYDLPGSASARTERSWKRIEIDVPLVLKSPVKIYTIPVHELFHRVQYAYNLPSGVTTIYWATEGTAAWAQKYRAPNVGDYLERIDQGLLSPDKALTARKYDACAFWVYAAERSGSENNFIKGVWSRFQTNGRNMDKAVNDTIHNLFGSPYTLDRVVAEWTFANFVKDFSGMPAYNDYAEDEKTTGYGYGPLKSVPRTAKTVAKGGATSTVSGTVAAHGADYFVYTLTGKPTKVDLTVTAAPSFSLGFVFFKGDKVDIYLRQPDGSNGNYSKTVTIDPARADRMAAIVTGNPSGGAYTLKVRAR